MVSTHAQRIWHPARPVFRWPPLGLAAALLAACGGGDDNNNGSTPPPAVGVFTVGGAVAGLGAGKTVTLQNLGTDDLTVSTDGNFVFNTRMDRGVAYAVTIKAQPAGQRCTVAQGTGTATADVSNVQVRCENLAAATFTVGGAVTGLTGSGLVLQNNGRDDLGVAANGGFSFATAQAGGTAYAVTVKTQPGGQSCTVANGTGTVGSAHVTTVDVRCTTAAAALPEGDWKHEQCSPSGPGRWTRLLWRISRQSDTRATVTLGGVTYADASCSGAGTVTATQPGAGGSFTFDRSEATASATAFWGNWAQLSGLTSRTVWARKGPYLCLLGDSTPTVFPTAASVESYLDVVIPNKGCYTQN
ncbi:hypothetical protein [Acidovorax sp. Q11]